MIRVYIAGQYTVGDPVVNVRRAMDAATTLLERGYAPYLPHLTMFWHLVSPQPYETWMNLDIEWVRACDALLRLPGESPGADREVFAAKAAGIPVYYSIDSLLACQLLHRTSPDSSTLR